MDQLLYNNSLLLLKNELIASFGCTEPIAIAYASAKASAVLDEEVISLQLLCSGNVIKNVNSVIVPKSNGKKGIPIAATLGAIAGDAKKQLEVLSDVTDEQITRASALVEKGFCKYDLMPDVPTLYIAVTAFGKEHQARVVLEKGHTQITEISKDHVILYDRKAAADVIVGDKELLTVENILAFAECVEIADIRSTLDNQIEMNTAISQEGLCNPYGVQVGQSILAVYGDDVKARARAFAAAASDARMNGCEMPVIINSGSGNQGITVSLPVIEYANHLGATKEKLYRSLVISNLCAIHIKHYIGVLSAFCGAVSAAAAASAAITYLSGGDYSQICGAITNTLANVGGIVCDGAKASCAAKIASAVDAAILGSNMAMANRIFNSGDGLVKETIEDTIRSIGHIAKDGMKSTDAEILKVMIC